MVKKIAIVQQKGGTGKTTTAVNLAAGIARSGKQTLLIDLDSQGAIASYFSIKPSQQPYISDLITGQSEARSCIINIGKNLDAILSDATTAQAEMTLAKGTDRERQLSQRIGDSINHYDYVIIDTAPSIGLMNLNGLMLADSAIIPCACDYLALEGLRQSREYLNTIRTLNHNIRLILVVPTFYKQHELKSRDTLTILRQHFGKLVTAPIRQNVKLSEAAAHHQTIFDYELNSSGSQDYRRLTRAILSQRG